MQQPTNVEVGESCEIAGSNNPLAPPSNNFAFGSNIEEPLSSRDEINQVKDKYTDEDDVAKELNFHLS